MPDFPGGQDLGPAIDSGFLDSRRILFDNVNTARDLGPLSGIEAELRGFIGDQSGAPTIFLKFQITRQADIRLLLLPVQPRTDVFLQVALLGPDRRSIRLDEQGIARGVESENTPESEAARRQQPGEYTIVLSTTQWNNTPYRLLFRVAAAVALEGRLIGRGGFGRARLRGPVRLRARLRGQGRLGRSELFSGRPITNISCRLRGRGKLGGSGLSPLREVPSAWISRLTTPAEGTPFAVSANAASTFVSDGGVVSSFIYRPPGASTGNARLCFVKHRINGTVQWSKVTPEFISFSTSGIQNTVHGLTPTANNEVIFSTENGRIGRLNESGEVLWLFDYTVNIPGESVTLATQSVAFDPATDRVHVAGRTGNASEYPTWLILDASNGNVLVRRRILNIPLPPFSPFGGGGIQSVIFLPDGNTRYIFDTSPAAGGVVIDVSASGETVLRARAYRDGGSFSFRWGVLAPSGETYVIKNDTIVVLDSDLNPIQRLTGNPVLSTFANSNWQVDGNGVLWGFDTSDINAAQDVRGGICYHVSSLPATPGGNSLPIYGELSSSAKRLDLDRGLKLTTFYRAPATVSTLATGRYLYIAVNEITSTGSTSTSNGGFGWGVFQYHLGLVSVPVALTVTVYSPTPTATAWGGINTARDLALSGGEGFLAWERGATPVAQGLSDPLPTSKPVINPATDPDPLRAQVTLHLPMTGAEGSRTAFDLSDTPVPIFASGGIVINSATSPFGDQSMDFNGIDSFLFASANTDFQFDRGDLCLETWIWLRSSGAIGGCIFCGTGYEGNTALPNSFALVVTTGRLLAFRVNGQVIATGPPAIGGSSGQPQLTDALPLETWTHVSLIRQDDVWRASAQGVIGPRGYKVNASITQGELLIGRGPSFVTPEWFNGRMRDFRLTKNSRFRASFTPRAAPIQVGTVPTAPADATFSLVTLLLPFIGPRLLLKDAGPLNLAPTAVGGVEPASNAATLFGAPTTFLQGIATFSPSATQIRYANNPAFSFPGDFRIECWVNFDTSPTFNLSVLLSRGASNVAGSYQITYNATTGQIRFLANNTVDILMGTATPGTFQYLAVGRVGTELSGYVGGVRGGTTTSAADLTTALVFSIGNFNQQTDVVKARIGQFRIKKGEGLSGATIPVPTAPWPLFGP